MTGRRRSGQQSPSTPWHAQGGMGRPAGDAEAAISDTMTSISRFSSSLVI
jgi:hypothetical protein